MRAAKNHAALAAADLGESEVNSAYFRNYLRKHPNTVKEYGKIKKEAAKLYPNDIEKYCMYKSQIIEKIYKEIGL